jgi:hypothetical protein
MVIEVETQVIYVQKESQREESFLETVRGHLSIPLLPLFLTMSTYIPPVSIHIRPHLYHSDLLVIIDAPH